MTCDLQCLQHYPELLQLLNKGTKFKSTYCADPRSNLKIMLDLCTQFISKASREDALPNAAYNLWHHVITTTFVNITADTQNNNNNRNIRKQSIITNAALQQIKS
jgi:hypothetical protein